MRKHLMLAGLAVIGSLACGAAFANSINSVQVEPTFECAGIIVTLAGTDDPGNVALEVKGPGDAGFRRAHDLVRYDNYHMAGSLFDLKPATAYEVRVTLAGQSTVTSFTTRPEFALPAPLRTVGVAGSSPLQAAISGAQPGDEIVLAPGTYAGGITIAASGTAAHPIVVRGTVAPSERSKPVDQRTGLPVINGSGSNPVINVTGSHVVLKDLRLENTGLIGIQLTATKYCVIEGCQITGRSSGYNHYLYVNGGGANGGRHLIQDNYLADSGSAYGYGILQHNRVGPGTVIRRNIITGFHDGINPSGDELELTDVLLPENHPDVLGKWPNHSADVYENIIRFSTDDDIEMDGIAVNHRVFRNYLSTGTGDWCVNAVSIAPVAPGPFFFVRNVMTNFREGAVKYNTASYRGTIRNCFFYHNTIKNDLGAARRGTLLTLWEGDGPPGTPSKNTQFKNNIFVGDKMLVQRLVAFHTPQYNPNYWFTKQTSGTMFQWGKSGPYYSSFAAWQQGTGQEAGGYYGDPMVDNATFRLKDKSPAVDKGVLIPGINDRYYGSAPDMGAYEYGAPVADTDPGPVGSVPGPVDNGTMPPPVPTPVSYTISGYVRDATGRAVAGALVALSGDASMTALCDANGFYRFTALPGGNYTVAANKTGYTFAPAARTWSPITSDQNNQDFAGTDTPPEATLANAVGYPNPWKAGNPYSPVMKFKNLTEKTKIRIFTVDGQLVKEIYAPDRAEVQWDVAGENIASGIYLCVMANERGETRRQKIVVIR